MKMDELVSMIRAVIIIPHAGTISRGQLSSGALVKILFLLMFGYRNRGSAARCTLKLG